MNWASKLGSEVGCWRRKGGKSCWLGELATIDWTQTAKSVSGAGQASSADLCRMVIDENKSDQRAVGDQPRWTLEVKSTKLAPEESRLAPECWVEVIYIPHSALCLAPSPDVLPAHQRSVS